MDDMVITIFGSLIAAVLGGMAGRWVWRRYLLMHRPYDERVKLSPPGSGMSGFAVPIIPKDRWW